MPFLSSLFSRFTRLTRKDWIELLLVLALFALGIFLRIYKINELTTFTYDQGRDMYVLQQMTRGDFTLIGPTTGLPGVFLGPFMYYFLLPGFMLAQGDPVGVVVWLGSWSMLVLPLAYFLLRGLVGRKWALAGWLLIVVAEGGVGADRVIWNPSLVVPTILPAIVTLLAAKQKPWLLSVSALLFGLSLHTELAYTFFLIPLAAVWAISIIPWKKLVSEKKLSDWIVWVAAPIAIGAATFLPQVLFELRNQAIITTSIIREFNDPAKKVPLATVLEERPFQMWHEFTRSTFSTIPLISWLVAISFIGSLVLLFTDRRPAVKLLVGYLWLPILGILFQRGNYGHFFGYYVTAHYFPIILMLIIVLASLTSFFKSHQKNLSTIVIGILVIAATVVTMSRWQLYQPERFGYTIALQKKALLTARELSNGEELPLQVFVPNLLPVNYQYLSEWMSSTKQTTPMPFTALNDQLDGSFIAMFEPYSGDGGMVAHRDWRNRFANTHTCTTPQEFGIISVQRCDPNKITP